MSVTVCLCALVMFGEVERKTEVPFPFDSEATLTARLTLTEKGGLDREDQRAQLLAALRDQMLAIPGVGNVAFSSSEAGLLVGRQNFSLNGEDTPAGRASLHTYTNEAFDVMGLRLLSGRLFTPFDTIDTPRIAVVNRIFAERFLGGADALGQQIQVRGSESSLNVVGVVSDLFPSTAGYGDALIIVPYAQFPSHTVSIVARTEPGASRLAGALQLALAKIAPDLATEGPFEPVRALFRHRQGRIRTLANLLALFSVVSIVSASLGLYGIISYSVRARRRELGMRLALGATRAQIIRLVVAQARWQLGSGLAAGIVAGFGLIQVMFSFMGGVNFNLLPQLGLVVVFAVGFCMAATGIPAWRASRMNPVEVLRGD